MKNIKQKIDSYSLLLEGFKPLDMVFSESLRKEIEEFRKESTKDINQKLKDTEELTKDILLTKTTMESGKKYYNFMGKMDFTIFRYLTACDMRLIDMNKEGDKFE